MLHVEGKPPVLYVCYDCRKLHHDSCIMQSTLERTHVCHCTDCQPLCVRPRCRLLQQTVRISASTWVVKYGPGCHLCSFAGAPDELWEHISDMHPDAIPWDE